MLFPLKTAFPQLVVQGFDFSPRAIQMCSDRAKDLDVISDYLFVRYPQGLKATKPEQPNLTSYLAKSAAPTLDHHQTLERRNINIRFRVPVCTLISLVENVEWLRYRRLLILVMIELTLVDLSIPSDKSNFSTQADIATLIYVLSAIHPDKHAVAVKNMRKYVKVCTTQRQEYFETGGSVIVRDYGVNDYAMIRFKRGAKLADRFYVRQDGTRSYYFRIEELEELFKSAGFVCLRKEYLHRQTINHQKQLNVPRIFVQARFVKR
ncbi:unnamed protein product [Strongylus vulgaris]|uniref:Methyltransferase type 11 domain-containing protein n=1 Tax=Strongylus vulgaris TaxID=40348 RepID=A0A3P7IR44_STRVU|nr:unnamed protein product [Strongylus vulgaris]